MKSIPGERVQTEILAKMPMAKKWESACLLRETAWRLKTAGIRAKHPEWTDEKVHAEVKKIFLYATT